VPKKPVIFEQVGENFDDVMNALLADKKEELTKEEGSESEEPERKGSLRPKLKVDKHRASEVLDRLKGKSKSRGKTKSES